MNKVMLDDVLRSKLNGCKDQVEVCDADGQSVGHFVPIARYKQMVYEWAKLKYPLEDLERRFQEVGGRTTPEVLARLEQS